MKKYDFLTSHKKRALYFSASMVFFWSNTSQAACYLSSSPYSTAAIATPFEGAISTTPNTIVGKRIVTLARWTSNFTPNVTVKCTSSATFYYRTNVSTSGLVNSGFTDDAGWPVYRTSYPGIGVGISPGKQINTLRPINHTSTSHSVYYPSMQIYLIRIGDIAPGIFSASMLPFSSVTVSLGHSNSMVQIGGMTLTGSIAITAPTCTTPDVLVDMGDWSAGVFAGKNSGTEWRDASIKLTNCGQFHGEWLFTQHHIQGTSHTAQYANTWTLSLTPLYGTEDAANGIMKIDSSSGSASGVGIQLGYGSTATAGANLVNFLVDKTDNLPTTGDTTINIPLAARYVQTEDTITGGRADSKATFTISYK